MAEIKIYIPDDVIEDVKKHGYEHEDAIKALLNRGYDNMALDTLLNGIEKYIKENKNIVSNLEQKIEKLLLKGKTEKEIINKLIKGSSGDYTFEKNTHQLVKCAECGDKIEDEYYLVKEERYEDIYSGNLYYHPKCGKELLEEEIREFQNLISKIEGHEMKEQKTNILSENKDIGKTELTRYCDLHILVGAIIWNTDNIERKDISPERIISFAKEWFNDETESAIEKIKDNMDWIIQDIKEHTK
jgi:hypothetical protein